MPENTLLQIGPVTTGDREWIRQLLTAHWGATIVVSRGRIHDASRQPGFIARWAGAPAGLVTYCIEGDQCEITSVGSEVEGRGIGTALIEAAQQAAQESGCRRLWLITTNDNTPALRFYQKRGFILVALHPGAVEASRKIKPEIPLLGIDGIPIRDEIELEMRLDK